MTTVTEMVKKGGCELVSTTIILVAACIVALGVAGVLQSVTRVDPTTNNDADFKFDMEACMVYKNCRFTLDDLARYNGLLRESGIRMPVQPIKLNVPDNE